MPPKKFTTHPLEVKLGFKTFYIKRESLAKEKLFGCVDFASNTITIDPSKSIEDYKGTLLHEILHVGFDIFGLGDVDEMPTIGNEYLTHVTTNILQLLAGLNPELIT